jgi:hypothetical protein
MARQCLRSKTARRGTLEHSATAWHLNLLRTDIEAGMSDEHRAALSAAYS